MFEFLSERVGLKVGLTLLTTPGSTVAILAQGTSWAVAVTQAFLVAVQIPRVWVLEPRGFKIVLSGTPRARTNTVYPATRIPSLGVYFFFEYRLFL